MVADLESLATNGRLRAAINTGNRALVQLGEDGTLQGVSPALARRLAEEIGATLEPVLYDGAGKVFADAANDAWDVGFLAIDATRAERIDFTRPYIVIEATYAVRSDSDVRTVQDADRSGRRILVSSGSAYDYYLSEALQAAQLERSGTPAESFAEFRDGRAECVAGVRETLEAFFGADEAVRILPDGFRKVEQAMVLPRRDDPRLTALDDFVRRAIQDGVVNAQRPQA